MRRRATYIHRPSLQIDPSTFRIDQYSLWVEAIEGAREERLILSFKELPEEVWNALKVSHELHIRWQTDRPFNTVAPYLSRIPPGLHISYTPLNGKNNRLLCPLLQKMFSSKIDCHPLNSTFSSPTLVSERFATTSTLEHFSVLPSLKNLVIYLQRNVCTYNDLVCLHSSSLLNIADSVDISYDSISHSLTLSVFWSAPPDVYYDPSDDSATTNAWRINVQQTSENDQVEIGILSSAPSQSDPSELTLSGFLITLNADTEAKGTLFSFPSRHQSLSSADSRPQIYSVSLKQPTGLHPTMQLTFPSTQSLLQPPENAESPSTCALHTYLTLPKDIFADPYAFVSQDPQFQKTHRIKTLHSISGETDLEAPSYAVSKWGQTLLFEILSPSELSSPSHLPDTAYNVTIPLHLRYLPPSNQSTHAQVEVPWPIVFWACTAEEGSKFNVSPFDRIQLGYVGLFGPRTSFWHLNPDPAFGSETALSSRRGVSGTIGARQGSKVLVETIDVPVLYTGGLVGEEVVQWGTLLSLMLGFVWVVWCLVPGLGLCSFGGKSDDRREKVKKRQ